MSTKKELEITNEDIELLKEMKKNCLKSNVYEDDKRLLKSNAVTKFLMLYEENEKLKARLELFENGVYFSRKNDRLEEENDKLKKQLEDANEKILLLQASEPMLNYKKSLEETQQKAFIKYLENKRDEYAENLEYWSSELISITLSKYKEIIGGNDV